MKKRVLQIFNSESTGVDTGFTNHCQDKKKKLYLYCKIISH